MNEKGFWNDDWMKVQQQYWEKWTNMSQQAMGVPGPQKSPWEHAIEHWWQAVSPAAPTPTQDFMGRMMDQGKVFFRMAEEFTNNLQGKGTNSDWTSAVQKTFGDIQKAFSAGTPEMGNEALHKMMAFWELPLDNWQRMASSMSVMPGDVLRNMPHHGDFEKYISAPGLGYTREEQGQQQEVFRLSMEYQRAIQAYTQFFSQLGMASVDRMQKKISELSEQGSTVDSARGLYELWVSSCEDVYGEQVMSPEYAKLHGQLVNSLMALKKHLSNMVDETLGAMNMPTRAELRTLQDRLQETRRENKRLRSDLGNLQDKVEKLTGAALAAKPANIRRAAPAKAAAPKQVVARKKVASKKKVAARRTSSS